MPTSLLPLQPSNPVSSNGRPRPARILLCSSWQTVNIGDIGHTPGLLALLDRHLPESKITLWPGNIDRGVREMLLLRFPCLHIAEGNLNEQGQPDSPDLRRAFEESDFLLHGSGPYVVALEKLEAWRRLTGKPAGIYGVTIDPLGSLPPGTASPDEGATLACQRAMIAALPPDHLPDRQRRALEDAAFVFCRETLSLDYLRAQGISTPTLDFGPDAAFGIDLRDDPAAESFLRRHELKPGAFICVIPRLRYTPYHLTHDIPATPRDEIRAAISERHRENDLGKLRDMIVRWVRATGLKVLVCPEMTYQVDVGRELCGAHLPPDVRPRVVWRPDYWLPDEACSTYARALAVVSLDNHSPIFALTVGTPTLFARQPTDTIKGQMWNDIGLGDWHGEIGETDGEKLAGLLLAIYHNPKAARDRVARVMHFVRESQCRTLDVLENTLSLSRSHPLIERVQ